MPAPDDLEDHVRLVAILTIALGGLSALASVILLVVGGLWYFPSAGADAASLVGPALWSLLGVLVLWVLATWGIGAGAGLLSRQGWARPLVLVLALLSLPGIPFGTIYGVYALWVLTRDGVVEHLDAPLPWAE